VRFGAVGALYRAAGELLASNGYHGALEAEQYVLAANNEGQSEQEIGIDPAPGR
jgi:hypothetical protein